MEKRRAYHLDSSISLASKFWEMDLKTDDYLNLREHGSAAELMAAKELSKDGEGKKKSTQKRRELEKLRNCKGVGFEVGSSGYRPGTLAKP
jgi:hypothetical protein